MSICLSIQNEISMNGRSNEEILQQVMDANKLRAVFLPKNYSQEDFVIRKEKYENPTKSIPKEGFAYLFLQKQESNEYIAKIQL